MASIPDVSVIMSTRALPERALRLRRARESVLEQRGVRASLIVVVNGPERDPGLVRRPEGDRSLLCSARHAAADLHLEEVNLAGAWAAHLRSLVGVGGWRHLPSTRRFLRALWAGGRGSAG